MTDTHLTAPTRFVEVKGGSGQPPLFFLQHFRGGMDHWDPIMTDGLAAGREVILYDYRGCASSTGAPRTLIEEMADDAAEVIRALGLSKVDVVGFSLGGMVAQELTRRHPDLVRKLMLLGTQPRGGNPDPNPKIFEVALRPVPTVDDFLFLFFGKSEAAKRAGREFWARRHERADQDPPSSHEVMQAQIEANLYYLPKLDLQDPFAHLRQITQPTFILNGQKVEDPAVTTYDGLSQMLDRALAAHH